MQTNERPRATRFLKAVQRLMEQRHLYSIRSAFVMTMPIFIVGAFATALNALPVKAYQEFMLGVFGFHWRDFGGIIFNATTQVSTLYAAFAVSINLVEWYNHRRTKQTPELMCAIVGLANYILLSLPFSGADALYFTTTGVTGLFVAIVVSVLSTELFVFLYHRGRGRQLLSDDPNKAVPQAFASVIPTAIIISLTAICRLVLVSFGVTEGVSALLYNVVSRPFALTQGSVLSAIIFNVFSHFMWVLGIHGNNALDQVAQSIFVPAGEANIAAVAMGLPAPNLITKTMIDVFVYIGGSGATLCLLFALVLFGNRKTYRTMMKFAFPTSLFNINEPLIFGIPIVLNPIYAIPFILTPMALLTTTVLSMKLGLVPFTVKNVSWAAPIFFSGYEATGSFAGVVLQAFNLALGIMIYRPFVRMSEKLLLLRFDAAYKQLVQVVTTEYTPTSRKLVARIDEVGSIARRLANELQFAIDNGELRLAYQPIVDSRDNTLHSIEALLRWQHPLYGAIHPMLTIALAEEIGTIDKLGYWILEEAIRQRAVWLREGLWGFHTSVNVSAMQLEDDKLYGNIMAMLHRHDVSPQDLQIEVTETVALTESGSTRANLARLHAAGISIAMDDFGVGHSSLLYMRTQPFTTLKIDGALTRELDAHPANIDIIATIRDLCALMNVEAVAEYVETQSQVDMLNSVGVYFMQGFHYAKPMPGEQVPDFLVALTTFPSSISE